MVWPCLAVWPLSKKMHGISDGRRNFSEVYHPAGAFQLFRRLRAFTDATSRRVKFGGEDISVISCLCASLCSREQRHVRYHSCQPG